MFRNQYDNDITTWSPQGRLHQVEYSLEAVKQGSAVVGIQSNHGAVLVALKRSGGELSSYQRKLVKVDEHMGIGFAGLASDARVLSNYMRMQALQSKMLFNRPMPLFRIVSQISDKAQVNTQQYGNRPYGVGLLVIGVDENGPHLYEFSPSGNFFEYRAMSIGARSQSAKTYLEKYCDSFASGELIESIDELIVHGLRSLRDTLQQDKELTMKNVSVAVVSKDKPFTILEDEQVKPYLDKLEASPDAAVPVPMDTE